LELAGPQDLWEVAKEKIRDILRTHEPEPLDKDLEKELSE